VGRARVSVCLSCFVLPAIGLAIVLASAPLTMRALTFVTEAMAFPRRPAFGVTPAPPVESCVSEGQTLGDNNLARFDLIRCALPNSTDKTIATAPPASTGGTTQVGTAGAPQQGTAGAEQPSTAGASQPGTATSSASGNLQGAALAFAYYSPGDLDPHDASRGRKGDREVYLPNIIFPLRLATDQHPHMNSQIWGHGGDGWDGKGGAGGSECDPVNYDPMQQRDTYCEIRTWAMPMCPGGTGHQGQDIRPPTCKNDTWEAVAVVDGIITQVTSNTTVRLKGGDGTDYFYLHMHPQSITVKVGQSVKQGDVLGRVSKYMDGDPNGTTMHLHFQVRQNIRVDGKILSVYVPVYSSLIAAYRKAKGLDPGIGPDGTLIVDPEHEIGAPKPPLTPTSQAPAPLADQSAPGAQPPAPTAGPATPPSPAPPSPTSTAAQSTPGTQPPAPAAGPATPPSPAPPSPTSTAAQSTPGTQPSAPAAGPTTPPPPAPPSPTSTASQSTPSAQPPALTAEPATPPAAPPPYAPTADQTTPGSQPPPPTPGPMAPPTTTASTPATNQPTSNTQPAAAPPQPPQSWWQKALNSTKEWWNKVGK
jgi:murein DD-endopeptidase MepM/ murein hydrolase activator NlpD